MDKCPIMTGRNGQAKMDTPGTICPHSASMPDSLGRILSYNALLFSQTRLPLCEWKIRSVFRCLSVLMEIDACNLSKSPARNCARD